MTEPDGPLSDRLRERADTFDPRGPALDDIRRKGTRRRWGRRAGAGLGVVVIVAGVLVPLRLLSRLDDGPADTRPAGAVGSKLVFASLVDDRYVLSTANGDGSNIQELQIPITQAIDPSWSPDGSQIVFSGGEERNTEPSDLYLVNADGSGLTRLTHDPEIVDWDPAWSPDGTTLAFTRRLEPDAPGYGEHGIAMLDVGTGHIEVLPFDGYQAFDPAWSPDGSRIAFTGNVGGLENIFVMDADGSNVQRLTDSVDRWSDSAPAWSPDGTRIAFDRSDQSSYRPDIYVMGADGSDPTQLTSDRAFEAAPTWSPDGTRIVFVGLIDDPEGNPRTSELYAMRPDGTDVTRLTTGASTGYSPNGFAAPSWTSQGTGVLPVPTDESSAPSPPVTTTTTSSPDPAADAANVVCSEDGIHLETPVVRAQPDGVHFLVRNEGPWWGAELHHESWNDGTAANLAHFDGGPVNTVSAIAPGSVTVACLPTPQADYADPVAATATLTIVDPEALYVPFDLACGSGTQSRLSVPAGPDADPAHVYRQISGVQPADVFSQPNYPGSDQYSRTDRVLLRDGAVVARFLFGGDRGGEWDLLVDACPGTGIAGA